MSFNLRHLKYFIATAELGQVSQAAMELSISQSAITTAIKDLEQTIGAQLFVRSSLGMTLTEVGRQFLGSSYEILAKVDEAMQVRPAAKVTGRLRLAATYTVIGYFLPYHLDRLSRDYPDLEISIVELEREQIEDGLIKGDFDMGVALTANIVSADIGSELLIKSPRRLWAPTGHHLLGRETVRFAEVSKEPFIMLTVDEASDTAMRYWRRSRYRPNIVLHTSSVEAVRSLVANNQGVSILSDMVYRPWSLEGRRLETIEVSEDIPPMEVGLVWRGNAEFSPAMEAVRSYFRSQFLSPHLPPGRSV